MSTDHHVKQSTILGLSLPKFTGTEAQCYEWIAAQKLSSPAIHTDYVVMPATYSIYEMAVKNARDEFAPEPQSLRA